MRTILEKAYITREGVFDAAFSQDDRGVWAGALGPFDTLEGAEEACLQVWGLEAGDVVFWDATYYPEGAGAHTFSINKADVEEYLNQGRSPRDMVP